MDPWGFCPAARAVLQIAMPVYSQLAVQLGLPTPELSEWAKRWGDCCRSNGEPGLCNDFVRQNLPTARPNSARQLARMPTVQTSHDSLDSFQPLQDTDLSQAGPSCLMSRGKLSVWFHRRATCRVPVGGEDSGDKIPGTLATLEAQTNRPVMSFV